MAVPANKRSTMTLYSSALSLHSHQVRIVLAEKGVAADIINIKFDQVPEDLVAVNPYNSVPTLVDRDLVLYEAPIIMEYLDERFPHPPLMPVYPVARAKTRLMMHRIEKDWYGLVKKITADNGSDESNLARKQLQESLIGVAPLFANSTYFLGDEFSLLDCCLAPLLWRLQLIDMDFGPHGNAIRTYADHLFSRSSFRASVSEDSED